MKQASAVLLTLIAYTAAIPPDVYTDSHLLDLEEVDLGKRTLDSRKFKLNIFGEDVHLHLRRSKDFLPETLPVQFLGEDEDGNQVIDDRSFKTGGLKDLFYDTETKASLMINELDGRTKMQGNINGNFVIEPVEDNADLSNQLLPDMRVKHRVYKTNITNDLLDKSSQFLPANLTNNDFAEETIDKRQIPGIIYPNVRAVVDYSHFMKLGGTKELVTDYILVLYQTVQVAHFSTMTNPVVKMSLHGLTVCETYAMCNTLNYALAAPKIYIFKPETNYMGKFAYQLRGTTGTDYDILFITTANEICNDLQGNCLGGFASRGTACGTFNDHYGVYTSGGMLKDDGAYWAYGIAHEMGHLLNMPHDFQVDEFKMTKTCVDRAFIMSYQKNRDKYPYDYWKFSPCSVYYLHVFLLKPESSCLKSPPPVNRNIIGHWPDTAVAGRYKSLDAQCKLVNSQLRNCADISRKNNEVCLGLRCNYGGIGKPGCNKRKQAMEGSDCGPNKKCKHGRCV